MCAGRRSGKELTDERAGAGDRLSQRPMAGGIDDVDARPQHGRGASGLECPPVGGRIDPTGEAADDDQPAPCEIGREHRGHFEGGGPRRA